MKKKLILMCIAGALLMTAVIGGTLAGFNTEINEQGSAEITVSAFSIEVNDKVASTKGTSESETIEAAAVPGGTMKIDRTIENKGEYDLYARVVINKKWKNIDKSAKTIQLVYDDDTSNWITTSDIDDNEQVIMYYALPIAAHGEVKIPLTGIKFDSSLNNDYAGKSVSLDISVDAVQAAVVEDSMLSEWGVLPTVNENGKITGIAE